MLWQNIAIFGMCPEIIAHGHDNVHITPNATEIVRFVNDKHMVTCHGHKGTKVRWLNPRGDPVTESRGRIHVEPRPAIAPGAKALVFLHIAGVDRGLWVCAGDGGGGGSPAEQRKTFRLIVNEPISFMDTPNEQYAPENKDATVRCEVRGDPEPKVSWQLNGQQIALPSERYSKLADGLLIKKVTIKDRGFYTCKAYQVSTAVSNVQERTIKLNIQHKPMSPANPRPQLVYGFVSGVVNVTCEALGEPPANFTWMRNKKPLKEAIVFNSEHSTTLQLPITDSNDFGNYTCRAANFLGYLDRTVTIKEGAKPDPPAKVLLRTAGADSLEFEITGPKNPQPIKEGKNEVDMRILGFRFQYAPLADWGEQKDDVWAHSGEIDIDIEQGASDGYVLSSLSTSTPYMVRVASRNAAGLSDYTIPVRYSTTVLHALGATSAADMKITILATTKLALFVFLSLLITKNFLVLV
ncbi:hemicentin-1-like [Ctenocephalides felis]|uniref:hemicentin-1-like n=1 Tax=Ctenocephalides felis TaxID=7515 RepID=UPI000E6E2579|nr:hemicentin-1-like [Ctenocephalides felis]